MKLDIDDKTEQALIELAELRNVSVPSLLHDFIVKETNYYRERMDDAQRLKNMKQNGGIAHEEMMDWLDDLAVGKDV